MVEATRKPIASDTQKKPDSKLISDDPIARINHARYQYILRTGHRDYMDTARLNEDFYLGGGRQWSEADRARRRAQKRPMIELNHILPAVNTATGLQLHSRVDMSFLPRGEGADEDSARMISKLVKQVCDANAYPWKESQVFEDGLIQQRGYLSLRIDYSSNIHGDIIAELIDPLDGMPDPDARSYDPAEWKDWTVARWYTRDDIEQYYGEENARMVESLGDAYFQDEDDFKRRSHFNEDSDGTGFDGWVTQRGDDVATRLYLVLDRQYARMTRGKVFVSWEGDITPVDQMSEEKMVNVAESGVVVEMSYRRIKWAVTCGSHTIHHDWSPYRTYDVIPYFPFFRRGRTIGLVDNLRSPQELENKSVTNSLEIQGTASNSGWDVPEGSLVSPTVDDLQASGADPGLVVVYRPIKGNHKPTRREPVSPPLGTERLADRAEFAIKSISGMSDAVQGQQGNEVSGVAIKNKAYMGQTQMGRPLDNLAFTRRLAAKKYLELIQDFFTAERVIRIVDEHTGATKEEFVVNEVTADGILNNVTVGKYDVVVTDTPTHATYQDSQWDQVMTMKKEGVQIPDKHIIGASNYSKKHELIKEIEEIAPGTDPVTGAKADEVTAAAELKRAQVEKVKAETVGIRMESKYAGGQTAQVLASNPQLAPLADVLLRSSGDIDQDTPPLVPQVPMDAESVFRGTGERPVDFTTGNNTNPLTPSPSPDLAPPLPENPVPSSSQGSPVVGVRQGIETLRNDG